MNETEIKDLITYLHRFTAAYQTHSSDNGMREIECLRVQFSFALQPMEPGDLFAGRYAEPPLGFSPQAKAGGFGFYLVEEPFEELLKGPIKQKAELQQLFDFWKSENTAYKTRVAYPEEMRNTLPSDNWTGEPGIAFPLYRISGTQLDYDTLLQKGIPGLRSEIEKAKNKCTDKYTQVFYTRVIQSLQLVTDMCNDYADIAAKQMQSADGDALKELDEVQKTLRHIAIRPPQTFRQAMQLMYLYAVMSGSVNYGCMDEYLGDFYVRDADSGRLTRKEALILIKGLWKLIDNRGWVFDSRVIVGGRGRRNEENANRFAMLAMEASRQLQQVTPQLTLRFYKGQEYMLMEKAITMIGEGGVYPMLYNDEVNIPAVANAFEVSPDEAVNYVPFGCGEYTLYHRSVGTPSGVINLLQALNVTLHEGKDPKTGRMLGVNTGHLSDFKDFNDVFAAYKKQVEHFVEQLAYQEALEYKIAAETSPFLLLSILYDDCIKQGKPLLAGGVRYLGGTLETYGNTNTADSLVAIKKVVFEEQRFTLPELVEMLDNNFEGYKKERNLLLQAPKYGNDNDTADAMKAEVDRHVCLATRNMKDKTNLHSYLVVIINNNANTVMGRHTAASADGREAWTYMANGNAPTGGCDTNGVTALLNSLVKPDATIHAGAVQNMKFSTSLFTKHRPELESLLYTYFSNGGAQAMINVLNKDDLKNAMNEPEKYSNLIVRVGGYCARFVDLPRDVQEEVLSRTLY